MRTTHNANATATSYAMQKDGHHTGTPRVGEKVSVNKIENAVGTKSEH